MARLLFTVWPYPTHLDPFIALAQTMRARGHDVAFYTGGGALPVLAREGFHCFPFREVVWDRVARTVDDLIAGRKRPSQMRRLWPQFLVATVPAQVRDLDQVLRAWQPAALVCDIALWAPILVLRERHCLPVAAFSHVAHCILPGPEGPIQGMALPRRRGAWQTAFGGIAAIAARLVTARTRRRANALRRGFGLAPLSRSINAYTGTLPLYLVPGAPEFDNNRQDLPPSVHYVGPCLWDKPAGQPPPDWLPDLPKDRPVVLVEEGALFTHEPRVLELAARSLAWLPLTVVLLAGKGRDPGRTGIRTTAPNVILKPHAPLSDVLPLASALITNGNSESVLAALQAGLPTVVLPSIWDQAEMAWRVQETGVGLRLSPWHASPKSMRKAVCRVLDDPVYRANAQRMGAILAGYGGPRRAAECIEALLEAKSPPDPAPHPSPVAGTR
ncbi:MAG TPA: nucleotide disphospho-sugar-binding domain-containing protein [Bryobacteraceae bacterium]|nr:nucleotide disphospho-sugar-binding domain-containing protein [Bryobacteraceae bacterium]